MFDCAIMLRHVAEFACAMSQLQAFLASFMVDLNSFRVCEVPTHHMLKRVMLVFSGSMC